MEAANGWNSLVDADSAICLRSRFGVRCLARATDESLSVGFPLQDLKKSRDDLPFFIRVQLALLRGANGL
jgi:hypothetical protein